MNNKFFSCLSINGGFEIRWCMKYIFRLSIFRIHFLLRASYKSLLLLRLVKPHKVHALHTIFNEILFSFFLSLVWTLDKSNSYLMPSLFAACCCCVRQQRLLLCTADNFCFSFFFLFHSLGKLVLCGCIELVCRIINIYLAGHSYAFCIEISIQWKY